MLNTTHGETLHHSITHGLDALQSPLLTSAQAGHYLRRDGRTLANWRVRGYGPRFVVVGRTPYYRVPDLEQWLAAQTREHHAAGRAAR